MSRIKPWTTAAIPNHPPKNRRRGSHTGFIAQPFSFFAILSPFRLHLTLASLSAKYRLRLQSSLPHSLSPEGAPQLYGGFGLLFPRLVCNRSLTSVNPPRLQRTEGRTQKARALEKFSRSVASFLPPLTSQGCSHNNAQNLVRTGGHLG